MIWYPESSTDTEERTDTRLQEPGDHDRFAHYILGDDPKAIITQAIIEGTPVTALCGKTWVPSRDPERYPVCPECKELKEAIMGQGE